MKHSIVIYFADTFASKIVKEKKNTNIFDILSARLRGKNNFQRYGIWLLSKVCINGLDMKLSIMAV